jgi:hypothetical protein
VTTPSIDGYEDLVEVGRGGFGVVYRATQPAFHRTVAIKVIVGARLDQSATERFERECRATGALSAHPNIVAVYGAGRTVEGDPFLVMDHLSGGSVAERVARDGTCSPAETAALGVAMCGALETAHRAGIVHRDVKPENILYSSFGSPQLVDFGIARMRSAYETRSGSISATLAHAAPEVVAGAPATPSADVYSLASVLHHMLVGHPPFWKPDEDSLAPLLARISTQAPPSLVEHGVPAELAAAIAGALAKSPAERPPSAAAFGEQLQEALRTDGLDAPTMPVPLTVVSAARAEHEVGDAPSTLEVPGATGDVARDRPVFVTDTLEEASGPRRPRWLVGAVVAAAVVAIGLVVAIVAVSGGNDRTPVETASSRRPAATTTTTTTSTAPTSTTTTVVVATTAAPPLDSGTSGSPSGSGSSGGSHRSGSVGSSGATGPASTGGAPWGGGAGSSGAATTAPLAKPGAVGGVAAYDAYTAAGSGTVTVSLRWTPPSSGGPATSYVVYCTLMQNAGAYSGPTAAPCRGRTQAGTAGGGATSIDLQVGHIEPGPNTWVRWEVVARNAAGSSAATVASVVVPNMNGLGSYDAFGVGRSIGLSVGGGLKHCPAAPDVVCEQSVAAGTNRVAGFAVTLWMPS